MTTNKYLEKIALNRLTKEILKAPGRFHVDKLVQKGYVRPADVYAEGLERGNYGMASKHNVTFKTPDPRKDPQQYMQTLSSGGHRFDSNFYHAVGGGIGSNHVISTVPPSGALQKLINPIHSVFNSKSNTNLVTSMGKRHEVHEVDEITKDYVPKLANSLAKNEGTPALGGLMANSKGKRTGDHANLAVLMRESNDISKVPHKAALQSLIKHRLGSGESDVLKRVTGKAYGERFSRKDYATGRSAVPNFEIGGVGYHKP